MWLNNVTTKTVKVSISFIPLFFSISSHLLLQILPSFDLLCQKNVPVESFCSILSRLFYRPTPLQNVCNGSCSDSISQTNDCWRDNERVGETKWWRGWREGSRSSEISKNTERRCVFCVRLFSRNGGSGVKAPPGTTACHLISHWHSSTSEDHPSLLLPLDQPW